MGKADRLQILGRVSDGAEPPRLERGSLRAMLRARVERLTLLVEMLEAAPREVRSGGRMYILDSAGDLKVKVRAIEYMLDAAELLDENERETTLHTIEVFLSDLEEVVNAVVGRKTH